MNAPCKDCKERQIGCHSTCEKYLEYKEHQLDLYRKRKAACDSTAIIGTLRGMGK